MRYGVLEGRHILADKDENVILKQSAHSSLVFSTTTFHEYNGTGI